MFSERQLTNSLNCIGVHLAVSKPPLFEVSLPNFELRQTLWEICLLLGHGWIRVFFLNLKTTTTCIFIYLFIYLLFIYLFIYFCS